jgi:hypothetical protein
MLPYVQLDHEIDQGAFQPRPCVREADETATAQLCRPFQIEELQLCAEGEMISRIG